MEFRDFIHVAHEYLAQMQEAVGEILHGSNDPELLSWLVEASDDLKNQAKLLGLVHFKDIIHTVNDILVLVEGKKVRITPRISELVQEAVRNLNELLHEISINYQEEHYLH